MLKGGRPVIYLLLTVQRLGISMYFCTHEKLFFHVICLKRRNRHLYWTSKSRTGSLKSLFCCATDCCIYQARHLTPDQLLVYFGCSWGLFLFLFLNSEDDDEHVSWDVPSQTTCPWFTVCWVFELLYRLYICISASQYVFLQKWHLQLIDICIIICFLLAK